MLVIAGLVTVSLSVAGCGPTAQPKPVMTDAQYKEFAYYATLQETCYALKRLNAEDVVNLRQTLAANMSRYQYDQATYQALLQKFTVKVPTSGDVWAGVPAATKQDFESRCAASARTAATNRVTIAQNNATQLQAAQLSAARAQQRAASSYDFQPQPFVMPQMPSFQPPQIQPLRLSGRDPMFFNCRQLSSYVTTCR